VIKMNVTDNAASNKTEISSDLPYALRKTKAARYYWQSLLMAEMCLPAGASRTAIETLAGNLLPLYYYR
jgi:hypothetical protein